MRQDNDTQATLLNIILKNYIALNLIDQADKLVAKSVFPDTVGNNQLARYMYYLGNLLDWMGLMIFRPHKSNPIGLFRVISPFTASN